MKNDIMSKLGLRSKIGPVINTNIVLFTILDMSKVFLWPHNYLLHWSHMITSICKYISNITGDEEKVNEMKLHMGLDDACAHEMQVPNAMLNTRVLQIGILWYPEYPSRKQKKECFASRSNISSMKGNGKWSFFIALLSFR